ncbi:cilium assembly protein DZIP1L isoform X1 [Pantherophis guttatus]|uniref:Cilium assembly protein DZIP1L isoform X1 n=2 Tax=Pantherophis guttatus TaxID=94885 RepID=A0ABM3YSC8_PANGU|nr:cilium assembly protein DZIP1L isoform X1 [Pantherophis guttatus]
MMSSWVICACSRCEPVVKPFVSNIYYPFPLPTSRHYWINMPGSTFPVNFQRTSDFSGNMLPSPSIIPAFKFQLRRETIDWRRFSAIDVERVARELDLGTLQENINSITFCNLDAEKCPYCQQPVDPVLLKVLKMAQLTIEYLLHSQEYLSMNLALQEEQHQAVLEDCKRIKYDLDKQAEELKGVKEESRRRKKMIATQQLLLQAGANNYHKCQLCDKTFMNYSFLQGHMERRHTEATAHENSKKKQVQQMESEIEELKVKLKETHVQLEAESQQRAQEAEHLRQREDDERRKFERWKEEERAKFHTEMEELRQLFITEIKDFSNKNSVLEGKLQELQVKNAVASHLGTLQDDDSFEKQQWTKTQKEIQGMKARIEQQKTEWQWKLRKLQKENEKEKEKLKNENEKLRAFLSSDQSKMTEYNKKQLASLTTQLREQAGVIQSQENTIKLLTSSKPREIQQIPKTDKLEESSEEELDDTLDTKSRVLETLRKDPNFLKQFRPILEETLEDKLETMGLKRGTKGIPAQTYKHLRALIKKQQQQKAKTFPGLLTLRDKLEKEVQKKAVQKDEENMSLPFSSIFEKNQRDQHSPLQVTPLKIGSHPVEVPYYALETPKPAPRSKVSSMTSSVEIPKVPSPNLIRSSSPSLQQSAVHFPSTSPFSSETEESEEETNMSSPKHTFLKTEPKQSKPVPRAAQVEESEWDSSDTDFSKEKLGTGKSFSVAAGTHSETLVQSMAKNLEKKLNIPGKKPPGGVKLFAVQSKEDAKTNHPTKKLQFSYEEDSDLEISSLEEISQHLEPETKIKKPQGAKVSGSSTGLRSTSIWTSSSTKAGAW